MPSMPDVLVYGDTVRHAELRHELPLVVPDPFLYAEADGQQHVIVGSLERARIAALGGVDVHPLEEFGYDELVLGGAERNAAVLEVMARACRSLKLGSASVPAEFPLELADRCGTSESS